MSFRKEKAEKLIKEELSLIFLHKLKDPALGFLTITSVKLSQDFKIAKIYISIYDKEKRNYSLEKVNEMKGFIRTELARNIKLRYTPELSFYIDDTADYVEKIDSLLKKIQENDNTE